MTIVDLKEQIMKDNLSNFYVFTGTEIGIINIYLEQMSNKLSLPITRSDSVASIYSKCMGGSLFGDDTGFYVIREDKDFIKEEAVYQTIRSDIMKGNVIVLLYEKLDSRTKFSKFFKECTVNFEKLTPQVLSAYIKKQVNLSQNNIDILIGLCSQSYDMCMLEVDKIKQYNSKDPDKSFEELLSTCAIYQPEESDVFQFTGAVCNRRASDALYFEKVLRDNGSNSVVMLGALYSSLKSIMLIQLCEDRDIVGVTGLDNKQIYFNKRYVNKYSDAEIVRAVKLIIGVVSDIKSGKIDDIYATKYVLANIM